MSNAKSVRARMAPLVEKADRLLGEAKKYIVYVDGEEKETITAGGHNAAEKKAQKKYPGKQVSVSYTESALAEGPENPTIRNYMTLLVSKLTQYDQATSKREAKKGRANIYRLGHLLKAAHDVEDRVKDVLDDTSPEAREKFKKALEKSFIVTRDGTFDLPPLRNVAKQLAAGTCNLVK